MANRINRNLRWVKRQLDLAGVRDVLEEEILDAMSACELQILGDTADVKDKTAITFDSTPPHDAGEYDLADAQGRVLSIAVPSTWVRPLTITNSIDSYEKVKREVTAGEQPEIVLQMNGKLYFWPVAKNGDIVTVYSIKQAGPYSQVEGSGDPVLDWAWDDCLRYGALMRLFPPENKWEKKYQDTFNNVAHGKIQQAGAPLLIDHSSRRLGF